MTERYSRQVTVFDPGVIAGRPIAIVGCGGTGFWTATFLAMSGATLLGLFDSDVVEESNRARLPLPSEAVGMKKTTALKQFINSCYPEIIITENSEINKSNILLIDPYHFVFECTDSPSAQHSITKWCKQKEKLVISVHYDGLQVEVQTNPKPGLVVEDTRGYTIVPSWVVPAVIASAMGVFQLRTNVSFKGILPSLYINPSNKQLKDIICTKCPKKDCSSCDICSSCTSYNDGYGDGFHDGGEQMRDAVVTLLRGKGEVGRELIEETKSI